MASVHATPDGGVIVVDRKGAEGLIIRQFDSNGKFIRNLGGFGRGPGEYSRPNVSVSVHSNGDVYVRDDGASVSVFGRNGALKSTFALNFGDGSTSEVVAASDGSVYLRASFGFRGISSVQRPMLHYTATGAFLDSITFDGRWLRESGGETSQTWRLLHDGRVLVGRTDKIGFMIADRVRRTPPLVTELEVEPPRYIPDERKELQAVRDLFREGCGRPTPTTPRTIIPEVKPLSGKTVIEDVGGTIWIGVRTTAEKIEPKLGGSCSGPGGTRNAEVSFEEPPVFAAFKPDGTFLGQVRFPLGSRVTFVGDIAWAAVPDNDGVPKLVKYRIH